MSSDTFAPLLEKQKLLEQQKEELKLRGARLQERLLASQLHKGRQNMKPAASQLDQGRHIAKLRFPAWPGPAR